MPEPTHSARSGAQGDLFDGDPKVGRGRPGRLERITAKTLRAAKAAGELTDRDDAMAQLAVELARSIDVAARFGGPNLPYALQAAGRELRETLVRLRLDPTSRGGAGSDPFDEWLARVSTPTVGNAADA